MNSIGISDMAFHIPRPSLDLSRIVALRGADNPAQRRRLERGLETTGQKIMRFPSPWEDTVSMAANAAQRLLERRPDNEDRQVRFIVSGTETSVDFSKPVSSWVQGMLERSGRRLSRNLATFQVQHACAGGTLGLLSAAALLLASGRPDERGLILCSDIARYECPSSAEITQGSGAAALLLDPQARLVGLDLAGLGFSSQDVDDFFRPLDSVTARVKGQYSMQCYHLAAESAFLDFCSRTGQTPAGALQAHDYLVFHVPFARMAYTAARHLLTTFGGLMDGEIDQNLADRGFFEPLEYTARTGNTYTASVWLNLAATLACEYRRIGPAIAGRKILISSYGSGNVMVVLSATISPEAPAILSGWDLDAQIGPGQEASLDQYLAWIGSGHAGGPWSEPDVVPPGGLHYLAGIREDGFREYAFKEHA